MPHIDSSLVRVQHAHAVLVVHDTVTLLAPVLGVLLNAGGQRRVKAEGGMVRG